MRQEPTVAAVPSKGQLLAAPKRIRRAANQDPHPLEVVGTDCGAN